MCATRSGHVAQAQNRRSFTTRQQLITAHYRLLDPRPVLTVNYYTLRRNVVLQAVIRMPFNYADAVRYLRLKCLELLVQRQNRMSHLEVSITFNAILHDTSADTWNMFYGLHFQQGRGRIAGIADLMHFGAPIVIANVEDLAQIPTIFNADELHEKYQRGYDSSNVHIDTFLNVVYLIQGVDYG